MTVKEQEQIIINARKNGMESLRKIESANIFYKNDEADYMNIITATTLEDAISMYHWMDTAARDEFINIFNNK